MKAERVTKTNHPKYRNLAIALVLPVTLAACSTPFGIDNDPRRVVADENEITIRARGWYAPDPVAETHCAQYAKRAVYGGFSRIETNSDLKLHYYRCEDTRQE